MFATLLFFITLISHGIVSYGFVSSEQRWWVSIGDSRTDAIAIRDKITSSLPSPPPPATTTTTTSFHCSNNLVLSTTRRNNENEGKFTTETNTSSSTQIEKREQLLPAIDMNPFLHEIRDAFQNFDDIIDDFFNKRMGNGEIFYGKRKYKPSGKVEGQYNGFGLTDKTRIDITRWKKEEYLARKQQQENEEKE